MTKGHKGHDKGQMSDREVMRLSLEALNKVSQCDEIRSWYGEFWKEITALRQALEQPSDIEAAVKKENEACAKLAETECCKCADAAAAIRERMK